MSLPTFEDDEETPFLRNQGVQHPTRTPLSIAQISILLTAWFAESITIHSISPYINQVKYVLAVPISAEYCFSWLELPNVGGDARKVGYYTGIIVRLTSLSKRVDMDQTASWLSLHFAAEAITAFPWNRLSDYVGRKL